MECTQDATPILRLAVVFAVMNRVRFSSLFDSTRLSLTGTIIVARDIAHAKLQERLDRGEGLPQYLKDRVVYYGLLNVLQGLSRKRAYVAGTYPRQGTPGG